MPDSDQIHAAKEIRFLAALIEQLAADHHSRVQQLRDRIEAKTRELEASNEPTRPAQGEKI